ncbi:hypothetical protein X975_10506, partial [Stegodyphus mimosarum]
MVLMFLHDGGELLFCEILRKRSRNELESVSVAITIQPNIAPMHLDILSTFQYDSSCSASFSWKTSKTVEFLSGKHSFSSTLAVLRLNSRHKGYIRR